MMSTEQMVSDLADKIDEAVGENLPRDVAMAVAVVWLAGKIEDEADSLDAALFQVSELSGLLRTVLITSWDSSLNRRVQ